MPLRARAEPQSTTELRWNVPGATTSTDWSTLKHSNNCFFFSPPPDFKHAHVCSNERVNTDPTVWGGHAPVSETLGLDRLQGTRGLGCKSKGKDNRVSVSLVLAKATTAASRRKHFAFLLKFQLKFINGVSYNQFISNCSIPSHKLRILAHNADFLV